MFQAGRHGRPQPGLIVVAVSGRPADQRGAGALSERPGPQASTVRVLHGKGDHDRVVGLDAGAWAILQLWLDRRAAAGINGHARVFCTLKGKPVKAAYVRTLLPRLARKAGIDKRVHAHGLRHTHAYELAGEGTPLHVIQAQLGHSSLATTDRYIKHLNPSAVVDAMKARAWSL